MDREESFLLHIQQLFLFPFSSYASEAGGKRSVLPFILRQKVPRQIFVFQKDVKKRLPLSLPSEI